MWSVPSRLPVRNLQLDALLAAHKTHTFCIAVRAFVVDVLLPSQSSARLSPVPIGRLAGQLPARRLASGSVMYLSGESVRHRLHVCASDIQVLQPVCKRKMPSSNQHVPFQIDRLLPAA